MNTFFIKSSWGACMASRYGILSKGYRKFYGDYYDPQKGSNNVLASQYGWLLDTPFSRGDLNRLGIKVSSIWWDGTWAY